MQPSKVPRQKCSVRPAGQARLIRAVLLLTLMALCCLTPLALADDSAALALTLSHPASAQPGDTITVELSCQGNPGLSSAQFTLVFDPQVLDCTAVRTGAVLSGMLNAVNPNASRGAIVAAAAARPVSTNGLLATYTFTVLSAGDFDFALEDASFSDADVAQLDFSLSGAPVQSPDDPPAGEQGDPIVADPGQAVAPGDVAVTYPFNDAASHWAADYIADAAQRSLIQGYGGGLYGPDDGMTRAQLVTILWRAAGQPQPAAAASFTDLQADQTYYHQAVAWAEENQVVQGVGQGRFDPTGSVTREQLATIFYRLAGEPGEALFFSGIYASAFGDSAQLSAWAQQAVYWMIYRELWCAPDAVAVGATLYPSLPATRAQIAVMITRFQDMEGGPM